MLRIGVIGYGYWGPNIVRNFNSTSDAKVVSICDSNPDVMKMLAKSNPSLTLGSDWKAISCSVDIDAVAIVTPVTTHYQLAKHALECGKHVFVEKPFTDSIEHAEELIELAAKKNLKIMVDHTFLFTGAVKKIKELIDNNVLGNIFYFDSTRINLGLLQRDINVIWDLAPHDFSIMNYLIQEKPVAISACGRSHFNKYEDIAYITVYFSSAMIAHFNVNWLSPVKVRNTMIGGEKKMVVWDDVAPDEKIKVYDKGVNVSSPQDVYKLKVDYRTGDMWSPKLEQNEALKTECSYFVDCINTGKTPINDGVAGLQVVKLLTACDNSLKSNGLMVAI